MPEIVGSPDGKGNEPRASCAMRKHEQCQVPSGNRHIDRKEWQNITILVGIYFSSIFFGVDILYIAVFILYMVGIQRRKQPVKGTWKNGDTSNISTQHGDLISPGDGDGDILRQQHLDRDLPCC